MPMGRTNLKEVPNFIPKFIRYETLKSVDPLTETQSIVFQEYEKGRHLMLDGCAGTGKTYIAIYLALKEILLRESEYDKLIIVRSVVPVREEGFLPGTQEEKELVYQAPYHAIFKKLFYDKDIIKKITEQGLYEFMSTSYIRGVTINKAIVIVDEASNLSLHELDSIITRLGDDTRIVFCGDFNQSDLTKNSDRNGYLEFKRIIESMGKHFSFVEFDEEDIVRSDLVKSYIIAKNRLGIK